MGKQQLKQFLQFVINAKKKTETVQVLYINKSNQIKSCSALKSIIMFTSSLVI